jgi:hypothetical protein
MIFRSPKELLENMNTKKFIIYFFVQINIFKNK